MSVSTNAKPTCEADILREVGKYDWYHEIELADGISTASNRTHFRPIWDFNLKLLDEIDFTDKKVLDIGCRDGLFSFQAEQRGAAEVIGIDNERPHGAIDFLIPFFESNVKMYELNVEELRPDTFGSFDVILFFGVLYHLRRPFSALEKIVNCLQDGGVLAIESGMLTTEQLQAHDLLYCPVEDSPYEETSCTFFNRKALCTTLRQLQCRLVSFETLEKTKRSSKRTPENPVKTLKRFVKRAVRRGADPPMTVGRQHFIFQKDLSMPVSEELQQYWNATHAAERQYAASARP